MPFIHCDDIEPEYVTPQHSAADGPLATGEAIEVGILSFHAGEQARPHQHPNRPRCGYLVPSGLPHGMTALADAVLLSCKNLVGGKGHRI